MLSRLLRLFAVILILLPLAVSARTMDPLVSVDWLDRHLGDDGLVVVDVRSGIDGSDREDFEAGHIPGAVYSDYTTAGWRQESDGVPGTLPPEADLAELIGNLGIDNDTDVVIVPAGVGSTDSAVPRGSTGLSACSAMTTWPF